LVITLVVNERIGGVITAQEILGRAKKDKSSLCFRPPGNAQESFSGISLGDAFWTIRKRGGETLRSRFREFH
jgi:hypothetical protein